MDFFTSDTHFNHANIISYCNRPFASLEAMNHGLIERWNAVVGPEDRVFHLGDFSMGPKNRRPDFVRALRGHLILVRGNHDAKTEVMLAAGFHEVYETYQYGPWHLEHVPLGLSGKVLCGHVHTSWRRHTDAIRDIINVGVDQWDFTPRTLPELLAAPADAPKANPDLTRFGS